MISLPCTFQTSHQNVKTKEHLLVSFVHPVGKFSGQLERMSMENLTRVQSELMKTCIRLPRDPLLYADGIHHVGDPAIVKWSGPAPTSPSRTPHTDKSDVDADSDVVDGSANESALVNPATHFYGILNKF